MGSKVIGDVEITDDQAEKVEAWLEANRTVPGWLDEYPLGMAYVDPRAGGRGIGKRRAYARIDAQTADAVPGLRGKDASAIREFIEARKAASLAPPGP